ncbi:MAG: DUF3305 domain-containing protein [Rhodospirillales bacterium]|nr:DUF3305 domain-containing protein [Rhodospirillales bacterium]
MVRSDPPSVTDLSNRMRLGIVVERRDSSHTWGAPQWRPIAVMPGVGPDAPPRCLREGAGWSHWLAGSLELELFRRETEGYRLNLFSNSPQVFVVVRPAEDSDGVEPFLATACPYEAQDYMDSGEETVEGVAMPEAVTAWVQAFVDRHHQDEPFVKRKQKPKTRTESAERDPFWRPPPVVRRGS